MHPQPQDVSRLVSTVALQQRSELLDSRRQACLGHCSSLRALRMATENVRTGDASAGAQLRTSGQAGMLVAGVRWRQEAQRSLALTKKDVKLCGRELAEHLAATEAALTSTLAKVRPSSAAICKWAIVWWAPACNPTPCMPEGAAVLRCST